jgi:hypothetical protein
VYKVQNTVEPGFDPSRGLHIFLGLLYQKMKRTTHSI